MYRPCRETYEESLKDVAMFESVETMFYQIYDGDEFSVREVISKSILSLGDPIGDDDQIGWKDVKPVFLNLPGEEQKCIGYCTMEVDKESLIDLIKGYGSRSILDKKVRERYYEIGDTTTFKVL